MPHPAVLVGAVHVQHGRTVPVGVEAPNVLAALADALHDADEPERTDRLAAVHCVE